MPDDAPMAQELAALEEDLSKVAQVHREQLGAGISAVHFDPRNPDALPMTWVLGDVEVILEAGRAQVANGNSRTARATWTCCGRSAKASWLVAWRRRSDLVDAPASA